MSKVKLISNSPSPFDAKLFIDDVELTTCTCLDFNLHARPDRPLEVTLTLIAGLDLEMGGYPVQEIIDQLENLKSQLTKKLNQDSATR